VRRSKIFTAGRLGFVQGEAEGSREARAIECGSKVITGGMPGEPARRWRADSHCFGWKHFRASPCAAATAPV
jgi:hypothetical protein